MTSNEALEYLKTSLTGRYANLPMSKPEHEQNINECFYVIEKDLNAIEDMAKFYSIEPHEIRTAIMFYLQAYKDFEAGNFVLKNKGKKLKW